MLSSIVVSQIFCSITYMLNFLLRLCFSIVQRVGEDADFEEWADESSDLQVLLSLSYSVLMLFVNE